VLLFDARLAIVEAKGAFNHSPAVTRKVERGKTCNGATESEKERELVKGQRRTRGKAIIFHTASALQGEFIPSKSNFD
jgi:hypothetical protein